MSAYYNIPGSTKTPQGVILVDPVSGVPTGGADAPLLISPLRAFSTAFAQAVTTSSASVELPAGSAAIHLNVSGCAARIRFGAGPQTAVSTDVRILDGVPYDLAVPTGATHMGVIAESGSGTLSGCKLV